MTSYGKMKLTVAEADEVSISSTSFNSSLTLPQNKLTYLSLTSLFQASLILSRKAKNLLLDRGTVRCLTFVGSGLSRKY